MKKNKTINELLTFKAGLKTYDCVGVDGYTMAKNRAYIFKKIDEVINALIIGNKSDILTALSILKSYDYLIYNKAKKEALKGLNIRY